MCLQKQTLGRSCDAVRHGSLLFDPISFECVVFQRLSQIIASENLTEREAEISNLPWTQTEKDNAPARCRIGQRACRTKKPVLCLSAVTDEDGHPLEKTKMNQEEGFVSVGVPFSKPASRARGITSLKISGSTFKKLLTTSVGPLIAPSLMNSFP